MTRYCLVCLRETEEEISCPRCELPLIFKTATVHEIRMTIQTIETLLLRRTQAAMRGTYPQAIIRPAESTHSTRDRWLRGIYGVLALLSPGLGALRNMWLMARDRRAT